MVGLYLGAADILDHVALVGEFGISRPNVT
jgi:hypothetical protein